MIDELKDIFPKDEGFDVTPSMTKEERMRLSHLVKVLHDDRNDPLWEKAHLALLLSVVPGGSRMQRLVARANAAYDRQDMERFDILLGEMKEAAERKEKRDAKANEQEL